MGPGVQALPGWPCQGSAGRSQSLGGGGGCGAPLGGGVAQGLGALGSFCERDKWLLVA